jgi:hypothetical protein
MPLKILIKGFAKIKQNQRNRDNTIVHSLSLICNNHKMKKLFKKDQEQ